ncbi:MAG: MlaE family lipid ABC transporter permease subunit [Chitinivibrionales bacterium]
MTNSPQRANAPILLPESFNREWLEQNRSLVSGRSDDLYLDFGNTRQIDSAAASFIQLISRKLHKAGHTLVIINISKEMLSTIHQWNAKAVEPEGKQQEDSIFVRAGDASIGFYHELITAFSILVEMIYWGTFGLLKRRDFRKGILGEQMYQLGFRALGIVGLLAFLIGVVLALQTAMQLKTFGADIFLAPMIGISMIRELGPLMTAIILAGRTGSATTAEIATMGVQEELDALKTMSLNPIQFVVVPKFWAITLTMPMLSIIATASGIFGGYLVAVFYLQTASSLFLSELAKNIYLRDFMAGFIKSVVFSWLIIWIGSHYGFKVKGGAEEVGRETTAAVVTGIFVIIIADAVFSFII